MGILDRFDLSGQVAIVTGAGTGLGREIALALAEAGCDIVGAARRAGPLEAVGAEVRAKGRRYLALPDTDVTQSARVEAMVTAAVRDMGVVSILVNNAGLRGAGGTTLTHVTDEDWHAGLDANVTAAFYCARAIVPHMVEHGGGRIINIASGWAFRGGRHNFTYSVAKAGLVQLTRALAVTYAPEGIRATCIAPGFFPILEDPALVEQVGALQPSGRVGFPHEIGPLAVFLASPAAEYVSGETVVIDGGALVAGLMPAGVSPCVEG